MQPSVSLAGKGEDSTGQQTDEVLNSEHVGEQVESVEDNKLSFQEPEESMSKAEENMLNVTSSRVFSAKCSERGKCRIQPIRSLKQFKYNRLNAKSKPGIPSPLVDSREDSNVLRESAGCPSSVFCTESVKKDDKTPVPMFSDVETHEQTDMDDNLMVKVHDTGKDSVKGKKNVLKSVISHSIKGNRVSKNEIDSSGSLCADKLADSAQTVNIAIICKDQTNNHSPSAEDGAQQGLVNKKTEQSPTANVLLEQLENKCTSAGEQTLDIQIRALEVNETSCKKSKLRSKVNLSSKRNGRNVLPSLRKAILCDETTGTEHVNMNFEVQHATHLEEIICTRPLDAEHSPFDPKSRLLPNEIIGPGTDKKGQCEGNCLVDVGECGFHLKEDVLSGQAAENHISNRSLKRGRYRSRSKLSDSSCEQSKECVSNQTTVMDDMLKKCNDIDSTCGSNPNLVPYEFQHDMASKHCTETGSNCLDKNGDKEEGCLHPQRSSTENNGQTSTNKSHNTRKLLSIPPRRVKMTPEEVSKAFGLKTSRSGRLIVLPLAHWCNQTVAYDLEL